MMPATMNRPRILDGGLATTLEAAGHALHPRLWSAAVFLEEPDAVAAVHRAFLRAGAEILVSASYQMSFAGLEAVGLDTDAAAAAMRRTVDVARIACESEGRQAIVAASVGPYGATLADGSEYTGAYALDARDLERFHRERLRVLATSGADLLAMETIPSRIEAEVLCRLLDETDGPDAWISFSCRDAAHLADGSPLADAAERLDGCARVHAVGINCTSPEHVSGLIDRLVSRTHKRVVVYPNSGERWNPQARVWEPRADQPPFTSLAADWARKGAWAIGGCCRVGPDTIRELATTLGR